MLLIAVPAAVLIGLSLGLLGAGGSILTVPALVYLLGQDAHTATTGSLVVVGVTALTAMSVHLHAGRVRVVEGATFALVGVAGTWAGTHLAARVDEHVLLLGFAAVMVVAAVTMSRRRARCRATAGGDCGPAGGTAGVATATRSTTRQALLVVGTATVAGLVTGFFGVGGGFVVVPALVLALGYEMPVAVGTSLLVIALNSGVALLARSGQHVDLDWPLLATFSAVAVLGSVAGGRLATRVPADRLGRAFTVLLLVIAAYTAVRSLLALT